MKRSSYILIGLCFLIIPLFIIKSKISQDLQVERKGKLVEMRIVDKPGSCLGTKVKWFMKVKYQGIVYSKQIGGAYCEAHNIGDMVQIRYLPGRDVVLLPKESVMLNIYAGILLSLVGLYSIIYGIRKKSFK